MQSTLFFFSKWKKQHTQTIRKAKSGAQVELKGDKRTAVATFLFIEAWIYLSFLLNQGQIARPWK